MTAQQDKRRVALFVDAKNMFYTQVKSGWFFDPLRLMELLRSDAQRDLVAAFWYTSLKDQHQLQGFRDVLVECGFTVRSKLVKEIYDHDQGKIVDRTNMDIEMVIDMLNLADSYDEIILMSGDGNFEPVLETLRTRGCHSTVVSTYGVASREIRNASDTYIDINSMRSKIEKIK
jgi:uncharacterized LabA/DUF88 family protein